MLPEKGVGGDTVITEVNQDVPAHILALETRDRKSRDIHGITVHGGTHEHIVVVIVAQDLLDTGGGALLEGIDRLSGSTLLGELGEDLLHVGCTTVVSIWPRLKETHVR